MVGGSEFAVAENKVGEQGGGQDRSQDGRADRVVIPHRVSLQKRRTVAKGRSATEQ